MQNTPNNWSEFSNKLSLIRQGHQPWNTGLNYDSMKMYRVLDDAGLAEARRTGKFLPKVGGTWDINGKPETYYNKGFAVQYSDNPKAPFVEVPADDRFIKFKNKKGGYHATLGEENAVKLSDRGVKIYQPDGSGNVKVIYDNADPYKYYGRKAGNIAKAVTPLGLFMEAMMYSPEAGTGSDIIGSKGNR